MILLKLGPLLLVLFLSSKLMAASIGHMGRLVDGLGSPLTGTADLQFEVHYSGDLTSTGVLCRTQMPSVPLANGLYHVNLNFSSGSVPCDLNDVLKNTPSAQSVVIRVQETSLGLTFDWQNILHVPAALRSEVSETAESVLDGAITAPKINQMGALNDQVLTWTGAAWEPRAIPPGNEGTVTSVGAGDGLSSGGTAADPILNVNVDGVTMEIATDILQVKDLGISTAKLSANAVTPAKMSLNTNQFDPLAPVLSLILDPNGAIGSGASGLGVLINPSFLEITTNQLTLANSGVTPGTYTSVTVDEKGRVTSAGSVSSSDLPFIESLETACANGEIYVANTGLVSCQRHLDFIRIGSATNYVELRVPGAHTGTSVLTFPSTGGAANQVLTTDGTGALSWQSPATTATPTGAAGGDLTGTYPDPTIALGAVTYAKTNFLDGDIPQVKVNGLTTDLAGKEAVITAGTTAQYWRGDKTWQTLNTSVVTEGTNLYYTTARARADAVIDAIVDGVLDIAPSQNAVFDALALKADSSSLSNYVAISGSNMTGPLGLNAQNELQFRDADSSNYVALRAPTSVAANLVLNLPGADGSAGQVLSTDGAGNLSWASSGAGSVTNVTASLPLSSSGGTTPNLSIAQANSTTSGFLSSTDWNTFNNKEPAIAAGTTAQYRRGDKTWQTLNTTAVPEGTNLYYTTSRVRADAVEDTIVDGVLNVAPSQNAVADALALKADALSLSNYVLKAGDTMTGSLNLPTNGLAVGTNQLVTAGGNVGIGTTSPEEKLHVVGTIHAGEVNSTQGSLLLVDTHPDGSITNIGTEFSSGGAVIGYGVKPSSTNSGTFDSNYSLELSRSALNVATSIRFFTGPSQTVPIGTQATLSEKMIIRNDGNVGIGVTSPTARLETSAGAVGGSQSVKFNVALNGTGDGVVVNGATRTVAEGTNGALRIIGSSGSDALRVNYNGNVGIGVSDPQYALEVGGDIKITGKIIQNSEPLVKLPISNTSLVGYWTFQDSGASDYSGLANHGTIIGAQVLDSYSSSTLWCDGIDDYVDIPNSTSLDINTSAITIEGTVFWNGSSMSNAIINKENQYEVRISPEGKLSAAFQSDAGTWAWVNSAWSVPIGRRFHFAISYDGTNISFSGDGRLIDTLPNATTGNLASRTTNLRFCARGVTDPSGFQNIAIDEIRVWRRILSAPEIYKLAVGTPVGR